jgi:fructokinase
MRVPAGQSDAPGNPDRIICAGEALIDLIAPPTSDWSEIDGFVPRIGGAPANAAVAIARLGGKSAYLGCMASDQPSDWIRERLLAEGVEISGTRICRDAQTRLAVVTGPDDQRDFVFYGSPAADTLLTPEDVDRAGIESSAAILAGSLLLLSEPGRSAMHRILEIATRDGVPISFDPNPRPKSWPDPITARESMIPFIQSATILKLGASEPDILGMSVQQIRDEQPGDAVLVLTDGPNGCWYWYGEDDSVAVPPVSVDSVDSTGAGDAFTAALTLRYVERGGKIEISDLRFASVVGAMTTTRQGAMDALPDRQSVEEFLTEAERDDQY